MTDLENQRRTFEELYSVAVSTGIGFDRILLAIGLSARQHLDLTAGYSLLRLRIEYDAVRGQMERAGEIVPSAAERVRTLIKEADRMKTLAARLEPNNWGAASEALERAADLQREVDAIQRRTPAEAKNARAVILVALTSLQDARQELGALAVRMGANPKRALAPAVALQLAGRVLDVWLDETCHRCDGTGVLGSRYLGDAVRDCPTCKKSGKRRDILGESLKETLFARDLQSEVDRQTKAAAAHAKETIYADSGPSKPMHPELVRRLAELRGAEAAAD